MRISENTVRDYVDRGWLACTITPTGRRLFDEEDIEVFKKNYYRKKTGENEQGDIKESSYFAFPKRICYTNKISATYYGINKFRKRILWKKLFLEDRHWKIRS